MLYLVDPPAQSNSNFCLGSVETVIYISKEKLPTPMKVMVATRNIHIHVKDKVKIENRTSCIPAKTFQQDSSLPVYLQRKMVVVLFLSKPAINQLEDSQLA